MQCVTWSKVFRHRELIGLNSFAAAIFVDCWHNFDKVLEQPITALWNNLPRVVKWVAHSRILFSKSEKMDYMRRIKMFNVVRLEIVNMSTTMLVAMTRCKMEILIKKLLLIKPLMNHSTHHQTFDIGLLTPATLFTRKYPLI